MVYTRPRVLTFSSVARSWLQLVSFKAVNWAMEIHMLG